MTENDPIAACRFHVTLEPGDTYLKGPQIQLLRRFSAAGFQEVSGLGAELEVLAYPEGGRNDFVHQLPVRHSWGRIILKRGLVRDGPVLWNWYQTGLTGSPGARRDGSIVLLDAHGDPVISWDFRAGLAAKWTGPDLNAMASTAALESLEIAHQGIEQRYLNP